MFSNHHIFNALVHVPFDQSLRREFPKPATFVYRTFSSRLCFNFFSRIPFDSLCVQFAFLDGSRKETKITWKI